ncbi:MAG: glycosyl transferase family 36 [Phycisphaerae bacterium]|nr:glycosyl transferase family 36 [Phycisphaerae bacterium]
MSSIVRASNRPDDHAPRRAVRNPYGGFSADGDEYRITDYRTPRPWVNIIANPRLGLAVSQTGSGFSWVDNSQLAVITRWEQDLVRDSSGKFLYVRDTESGDIWSLSPAPTWPNYDEYACRHGIGYTSFETQFAGIRATWTLFAHASEPVEFWRLTLENASKRPRQLELCAYLEWCCGVAPSPRREFHKLFLETEFDAERAAVFAHNHMWEVPNEHYGHWNTGFPYVSALACTEPVLSATGDKGTFLGRYGDLRAPAALEQDLWRPGFGRHEDQIAALRLAVELRAGELHELGYVLGVGASRAEVEQTLSRSRNVAAMDRALEDVRAQWKARLADHRVETPESSVTFLTNDWLRYQTIAGRIWGRCGYYQQSGAYGYRDQLQDSQVWLTIDPARCRAQINTHAAHQFADGSVYHWWHPLSEQGLITRMTDDLLWLSFVTANYIRETGTLDILHDEMPFLDDKTPSSLLEHVRRAFARVFKRTSPHGLPFIGAGDWNDGLSAAGLQERGESIWLGHFLAGLLADWAEIHRRIGNERGATDFEARRAALVTAINTHGWDGRWYLRATLDDGSALGSAENQAGRIFLNAQTWAILNDVAPPDRARECWDAVCKHLISEAGALLLAPAFEVPDQRVGYITRYAPGLRENGGVYTHAATWAIAAACKMRDAERVDELLAAINPAIKDPEQYWAEPYVLPGNVDGPQSPHHGRGGWTWYTGSAAWLHRVISEWVLGVRPEWDGLRIAPCLPPDWKHANVQRPYRGATLDITINRKDGSTPAGDKISVTLDGKPLKDNLVPAAALTPGAHTIVVTY